MSLQYPTGMECPGSLDDDLEMKRSIESIQAASPDSSTSVSVPANSCASKRKNDNEPSTFLSTDEYWEEKARDLQNPFVDQLSHDVREDSVGGHDDSGDCLTKPRPVALDLSKTRPIHIPGLGDINIQLDTPPFDASEDANCRDNGYHKTIKLPPLPNGAISDILLQTKSHCPKAQAWTKAERISEETKQRWLEKTKNRRVQGLDRREQVHLKMTVSLILVQRTRDDRQAELSQLVQRLRKAHLDHDQRAVSTRELEDRAKVLDSKMEDERTEEEWEERNLTRQQRVQRAHDRLHRALGLDEY